MIEKLVDTMLGKLRDIVSSDTVVGKPIDTDAGTVIPITKISIGFAAAGGNKPKEQADKEQAGSGTGGGAVIEPVAVISVHEDEIRVHALKDKGPNMVRIIESIPEIVSKISKSVKSESEKDKSEEKRS